jgi:outer membrane receptor protein involved in Fe transport
LQYLALEGGITQVMNSFYRGTSPRVYVDSAPHTVANAGITLSEWHGMYASVRYRHTSYYRLDGLDANIRASGLDVIDLSVTKQSRSGIDLNLAIDNVANKKYYETQNYFESRVTPQAPSISRIHGTPGYPFAITLGITFRPLNKIP